MSDDGVLTEAAGGATLEWYTDRHRRIMETVTEGYDSQSESRGYMILGGTVRIPATGMRTRELIIELVERDYLIPAVKTASREVDRNGFGEDFWEGFPNRLNPDGSLNTRGEEIDMAAKKAQEKQESEVKEPAKKKSRAASLEGMKGADFFNEPKEMKDGSKRYTFKVGHDAKFAGMCKRIIAGTADEHDLRLIRDKDLITNHKVTESEHLSHLLKEAQAAV